MPGGTNSQTNTAALDPRASVSDDPGGGRNSNFGTGRAYGGSLKKLFRGVTLNLDPARADAPARSVAILIRIHGHAATPLRFERILCRS